MTEYDGFRVARETDRGVATITLDVPEKLNRVSMGARDELAQVFAELGGDESVRVVVLRGAGDAGLHGGRRRRHVHAARRRDALAPARQRGRARALSQARDRAAARLLLRRRARARARLRLPRRERRRPARAARADARHDPGLGRGLAARQDDRRLAHQGRRACAAAASRPPRRRPGGCCARSCRAPTWAPPSRAWPTSSLRARRSRCARPSA